MPLEQRSAVIERANRQIQIERLERMNAMSRELETYEIKVSEDANDRYGAFKTGAHDDLATALGLAVQTDGGSVGTVLAVPPEMAALLRGRVLASVSAVFVLDRPYRRGGCLLLDRCVDLVEVCHVQVGQLVLGDVSDLVSIEDLSGGVMSDDEAGDVGVLRRQRADASHGHWRRVSERAAGQPLPASAVSRNVVVGGGITR